MGMTLLENVLLIGGSSLLVGFIIGTLAPILRNVLMKTALRRAEELREEFLLLPPRRILFVLLASGCLCGTIAMTMVRDLYWAAFAGIGPTLLSGLAVQYFRARRRKKVLSQIPGFLDILAGQVKAGHSLQEAISETIPLLPHGIREEISWVFRYCRLGMPLSEAFCLWEERMPCEEVALVIRPLRVALPSGGNIVDLLERCRDILRSRSRTEEKIRSMTAQARLQAITLTLLPPAFTAALAKVDPDFLPLCLGTIQGKAILAAAAVLQVLGWLTIRKILSARP